MAGKGTNTHTPTVRCLFRASGGNGGGGGRGYRQLFCGPRWSHSVLFKPLVGLVYGVSWCWDKHTVYFLLNTNFAEIVKENVSYIDTYRWRGRYEQQRAKPIYCTVSRRPELSFATSLCFFVSFLL